METVNTTIKKEIIFGIYDPESRDAKAMIENGICVKIKILIRCGKSHYYSMMNHASESFDEQYPEIALRTHKHSRGEL